MGVRHRGVARTGLTEAAAVITDQLIPAGQLGELWLPHAHVKPEAVHQHDGGAGAGDAVRQRRTIPGESTCACRVHLRTSKIRLNGVSVARRNREKPSFASNAAHPSSGTWLPSAN